MPSALFTSNLDLDLCAQKPIRVSDGIAPHVTLAVADPESRSATASDNDPDVRAFTVETVRELGYDVPEARDTINALSVLRQITVGDVDLLFTDAITQPSAYDDLATRIRSVLDGQDSQRHAN